MSRDRTLCPLCGVEFATLNKRRAHAQTCHVELRSSPSTPTSSRDLQSTLPHLENQTLKAGVRINDFHNAGTANHVEQDLPHEQLFAPNSTSPTSIRGLMAHCAACGLLVYGPDALTTHQHTPEYIATCMKKETYCYNCRMTFNSKELKHEHDRQVHNENTATNRAQQNRPQQQSSTTNPPTSAPVSRSVDGEAATDHAVQSPIGPSQTHTVNQPSTSTTRTKVLSRCIPCGVSISENCGTKRHRKSQGHIDTCIKAGLYCFDCKVPFPTKSKKDRHHGRCHDPDRGATTDRARVDPQSPEVERKMKGRCVVCDVSFYRKGASKIHRTSQQHIDAYISAFLYYFEYEKAFTTQARYDNHYKRKHDPSRPTEFHCLDCDQSFSSNTLLKKHLRNHAPKKEIFRCEPCAKDFSTKSKLNKHIRSASHLRLKCFGSPKCDRTFVSPSAMIMHLESGACKSKIDRQQIDRLLQQQDATNIITIAGAAPQQAIPAQPSRLIPTAAPIEVFSDSDTDSEASVVLTPSSSRLSFVSYDHSIADSSEEDVIYTPGSLSRPGSMQSATYGDFGEIEFQVEYMASLVCPVCRKKFATPTGLQMHMASPVHSLKIYHCPLSFLDIVGKGKGNEREFKTLSALVQHLEHGSCEGGLETFRKAMRFVEDRMVALGLSHMQLLEYVQKSPL